VYVPVPAPKAVVLVGSDPNQEGGKLVGVPRAVALRVMMAEAGRQKQAGRQAGSRAGKRGIVKRVHTYACMLR
jgi:hypothetical protein